MPETVPGGAALVTVPAMYEFDSVSVSTYEAASLAAKLSEKSADGWDVVAIVPAGSDITAFLKRASSDATASTATPAETAASAAAEPATATGAAASEPAGWGTAPASSSTETSSWGSGSSGSTTSDSPSGWGGAAATSTAAATPTQPATPSVPPGWYHDPAGRYELRYWDGSAWTEHVSRSGQQYTDPPVA